MTYAQSNKQAMKEKRQVSLLSLWNRKKLPNRVIDPKESTTTTTTTTITTTTTTTLHGLWNQVKRV